MKSEFKRLSGECQLPDFSGLSVLQMPIRFGDGSSVPDFLSGYLPMLDLAAIHFPEHCGDVVYLTVDEKRVTKGESLRRRGLHVDGLAGWSNCRAEPEEGDDDLETQNQFDGRGFGVLTVSSFPGCMAWEQEFDGEPDSFGLCEHMRGQCRGDLAVVFAPNVLYWLSPQCVHESLPMPFDTPRQFARISLPSNVSWYEGYTANPLGVKPTGRVIPSSRVEVANCFDMSPKVYESQKQRERQREMIAAALSATTELVQK